MIKRGIATTVALGVLLVSCGTPVQQELPPALRNGPPSGVPVALQLQRWHMLDSAVSARTFSSMDKLFDTRVVRRAGPVWGLPRAERTPDFSYVWQGQAYRADAFPARTHTNALLILKDGRIISELYRNGTDPRTRHIGWSMTKSITSVLVGCALAEGRIESLDVPINRYLPELAGGGYEGVSIRDVMEMRSGVAYDERYDFDNP